MWSPGSLAFPIVLTTKKTLLVVKTIVKCRKPGEETNSETLNLQIFFRQLLFGKFASFLMVLDLMYEFYVISLPDFLQFLIRRSTCFVKYFHIWTKRKSLQRRLAYCFNPEKALQQLEIETFILKQNTRSFFVSNF